MSYTDVTDDDFITDLLTRKEFYWYKKWDKKPSMLENIIPRFMLEDAIKQSLNLRLTSYQQFVQNFMNPNTPYKRLLLEWGTGSGKSIGALSIAMNFIKQYSLEKEVGHVEIGSVFIIGFSERVFKYELLKYPEFGFLNHEERHRLEKLKRIAATGSMQDRDRYQDFTTKIKKRFSNRKGNGFFKFFGYKAFVNRIFIAPADVNLNEISEEKIRELLAAGTITYNEELFTQFKNSLIICDEIHNVYNSVEKNNWGIAIQAVLDREPTCRAVFASATPLNNSPTEVVDLLNLLLVGQRLSKDEFFTSTGALKPGALNRIGELSRGRVSYFQNVNPKYFPSVSFEGDSLKQIPYLKFVRCPMSSWHYATYKAVYKGALSQDSQYLVDFAIENPDDETPGAGLYQTSTVKPALTNASQRWKDKYGFDFVHGRITGDALKRSNLGKYSAKYVAMLDAIMECIKNKQGKIFIYHNIVHMSGVLFIEQVLLKNGFIDEFAGATAETICMHCGKKKSEHTAEQLDLKHGGSENAIELVEENGNLVWYHYDKPSLTIIKKRNRYEVPAYGMAHTLIEAKSYMVRLMSDVLSGLQLKESLPIIIEVPNYAVKLGDWLLKIGFKLHKQKSNYVYMIWKPNKGMIAEKTGDTAGSSSTSDVFVHSTAGGKTINIVKRSTTTHKYAPARFVMAHSDIDKAQMEHSLERFNGSDNTIGDRFLVLVGSKIIKESYNTKAIRNEFIMGRPDNIPTLIQIRGRAVRQRSHDGLPPDQRHVTVKIFTSCLPVKITDGPDKGAYQLSYEEIKYKEKIAAFQIIQSIDKVLHENAIDAFITNEELADDNSMNDPLGPLSFEPKLDKKFSKELPLEKLNLTTFNSWHQDKEVAVCKQLIKQLFIEYSAVWKHQDLFDAVRNSGIETEINTSLITYDHFLIAVDQLIWHNSIDVVEPTMNKTESSMLHGEAAMIIDRLYDTHDKIITLPGGQDSMIVPVLDNQQFYILFPIGNNGDPEIDVELPYRVAKQEKTITINMNNFVQTKRIDFDYPEKKKIFFHKYSDIVIENMESVICEYGTNFHIKFLEEAIEYVFRAWTDPKLEKHDYHEFYFKMLYYYDLLSLVLWAHTCKPKLFKEYTVYANAVKARDIKLKALNRYEKRKDEIVDISPEDNSDLATSGVINLLKSSINRTSNAWIPREFREQYEQTVEDSLKMFSGHKKKSRTITKVSADKLPIGHFISKFPRIFHPDRGFTEDPMYIQKDESYVENNIIIGYNEKSQSGVHIRFKLRPPIHNIKKFRDSRLIERGTVCKSKSKDWLMNLAKKLDIALPVDERLNVEELCVLIKSKLLRLELKERIKKTNIKWMYQHYEQPNVD